MNNNSDVKKASPVTVTFIIFQLFFILILIFSIPSLFPNDHIKSTETTRQPKIIIENIETVTPKLSNFDTNSIQQKLLKTVQDNTSTVNHKKRCHQNNSSIRGFWSQLFKYNSRHSRPQTIIQTFLRISQRLL